MYAEESGDSVRSGAAIANLSIAPVDVHFELTSLSGESTGLTGTITIPGYGHVAKFLNEILWPQILPDDFRGMLRVSAGSGQISVMGLRGRYNEVGNFLITTTPPVSESVPPSPGDLFFPHWVNSPSYTTHFVLYSSLPGQRVLGRLEYLSQWGELLNLISGNKSKRIPCRHRCCWGRSPRSDTANHDRPGHTHPISIHSEHTTRRNHDHVGCLQTRRRFRRNHEATELISDMQKPEMRTFAHGEVAPLSAFTQFRVDLTELDPATDYVYQVYVDSQLTAQGAISNGRRWTFPICGIRRQRTIDTGTDVDCTAGGRRTRVIPDACR